MFHSLHNQTSPSTLCRTSTQWCPCQSIIIFVSLWWTRPHFPLYYTLLCSLSLLISLSFHKMSYSTGSSFPPTSPYSTGSFVAHRREINGDIIRFKNRRCKCNRKAVLYISETNQNPCKLFFKCKTEKCNFYAWWEPDEEEFDIGAMIRSAGDLEACAQNVASLEAKTVEALNVQAKMFDCTNILLKRVETMLKVFFFVFGLLIAVVLFIIFSRYC